MGVVLRCAPERKCLHPEIPAPGWQDLLDGRVKPAEQKRGRYSGEGNGWKPKRDRRLLKENGTTRKQEGVEISPAEPWGQAGVSQGEGMLSLMHIWGQRAGGCEVCKENQKKKEEINLKAVDGPLLWDSNSGRIPQELIAGIPREG